MDISQLLAPYWDAMMGHQGLLLAVGAWIAACRVVFKPFSLQIKGIIDSIVRKVNDTPTVKDNEILVTIFRSRHYKIFAWFIDCTTSIKLSDDSALLPQKVSNV